MSRVVSFLTLTAAPILFVALIALPFSKPVMAGDDAAPVSDDLKQVYARTHSAAVEADFTAIARACSKVIPDKTRSEADVAYATNLFAWALNRRGEVRSDAAAKLVEQGAVEDARKVDQQANNDFATAVKYAPDNWRMRHNLAVSQAMLGDVKEAIESFSQVVRMKPDYANAFFNRAELYFETKQFPRAVADYTAAIKLSPDDARFHNGLAHAKFLLNNHNDAIVEYRRASDLDAQNAKYRTDLADALQFVGKWEEAAGQYRQAIASDKTYARAYRNVAWLLATCPEKQFRNPNLALSAARKAVELGGDEDYRTLDTLAAASAATGDSTEAASILRKALAKAPASARGELNERMAVYRRGESFVQSAVKLPDFEASSEFSQGVRTASAQSNE